MECFATIAQATEYEYWQDHIARVLYDQICSFLKNSFENVGCGASTGLKVLVYLTEGCIN